MFLRVSSLRCASHVEGKLAPCLPLPRPSTRCGVVNQQRSRFVEVLEVGEDGGGPCFSPPGRPRSRCRDRPRGGVRTPRPRSRSRTSRGAFGQSRSPPQARRRPLATSGGGGPPPAGRGRPVR